MTSIPTSTTDKHNLLVQTLQKLFQCGSTEDVLTTEEEFVDTSQVSTSAPRTPSRTYQMPSDTQTTTNSSSRSKRRKSPVAQDLPDLEDAQSLSSATSVSSSSSILAVPTREALEDLVRESQVARRPGILDMGRPWSTGLGTNQAHKQNNEASSRHTPRPVQAAGQLLRLIRTMNCADGVGAPCQAHHRNAHVDEPEAIPYPSPDRRKPAARQEASDDEATQGSLFSRSAPKVLHPQQRHPKPPAAVTPTRVANLPKSTPPRQPRDQERRPSNNSPPLPTRRRPNASFDDSLHSNKPNEDEDLFVIQRPLTFPAPTLGNSSPFSSASSLTQLHRNGGHGGGDSVESNETNETQSQ